MATEAQQQQLVDRLADRKFKCEYCDQHATYIVQLDGENHNNRWNRTITEYICEEHYLYYDEWDDEGWELMGPHYTGFLESQSLDEHIEEAGY